jgi:site-specific DNA-methyltransferase (adenine-specific)
MINLYNDDCFKVMDELIENGIQVDCIIADMPYGCSNCEWDKELDLTQVWERLLKIIKQNGAIVLFGTEPFSSKLRLSMPNLYRYDLYWVKEKPVNFFQLKKRPGKTTENICIFYKDQPTYNPQKTIFEGKPVKNSPKGSHHSIMSGIGKEVTPYEDDGTRYPTDLLHFNREKLGSTDHAAQKPVLLLEWLVKSFTNEGDTVLDFVMGSGSTGVACQNLNRNFIGIEIDPKYYNISKTRMNIE